MSAQYHADVLLAAAAYRDAVDDLRNQWCVLFKTPEGLEARRNKYIETQHRVHATRRALIESILLREEELGV
jgi:hypothetical protein